MDYIRHLGPLVLDHRLRRAMETLLRAAEEIYDREGLPFRARWTSTFHALYDDGPLSITELAERLRLTHPAIIGITNDMASAGLVAATSDRGDGRRRLITLTAQGQRLAPRLLRLWKTLAAVQQARFATAGCDIVAVLDAFENDVAEQSIADEVAARLALPERRPRRKRSAVATAVLVSATLLTTACATSPVPAQEQQPVTTAPSSATAASRVVAAIADSLIAGYIYEPTARTLADALRAELRAGAYNTADPGALATRLNATLLRVSNDRHLRVRPPEGETGAPGGPRMRRVRRSPGDGPPPGFVRSELLAGNVGYIDLRGFPGGPAAQAAVDSAMAVVAGARALIIDLGENRGGGPEMVRYLSAYLFDRPTHLVSTFERGMAAPSERWTAERIAGKPLGAIPVYVLTSARTFSAAESFAFGLKVHNRVTIVGERTGGGGHWGRVIPLVDGYTMFLPVGRTYDPRTGKGWEAEGLTPDIEVPYERALETALSRIGRQRM